MPAEPKVCTVESVVNAEENQRRASAYAVDGLSKQIIAQMNFDNPGVFVEVPVVAPCAVDEDGKDIECGGKKATAGKRTKGVKCTKACIPFMQPRARRRCTTRRSPSATLSWARRCSARAHSSSSCGAGTSSARCPTARTSARRRSTACKKKLGDKCDLVVNDHRICGIPLCNKPGTSNHEHGLAVDVSGASAWRKKGKNLGDHDFKWYGSRDPMHFTYNGEGGIDNRRENLRAFQKLWNANNKDKKKDVGPRRTGRPEQRRN